jgi:hypothetical protein
MSTNNNNVFFVYYLTYKGKGSVLTIKGTIEMDAIIMEGKNLKTGNRHY